MFTETPDLIQALVQEGTGVHADVFKRVDAAYPYGVRLWDGRPATRWRCDSARASTTRSTQPGERRARNAPNAPSRAKSGRHDGGSIRLTRSSRLGLVRIGLLTKWPLFADIVEEVRGNQSFHALERWIRLKGGPAFGGSWGRPLCADRGFESSCRPQAGQAS